MLVCGEQTTSALKRNICECVQLAELKTRHKLVILIRHVVFLFCKLHAYANFPIQARLSFARRTREFFVTNDEKYQTCLIFGLHVTNDENAVNVARTRGNFVDPT
jgi:hypothetical protein